MSIFAISDLHLSGQAEKPMDVFGANWANYIDRVKQNWLSAVTEDDTVIIAGDISWAIKLSQTQADLALIGSLPGKKIIIKGNHDYWWNSLSKLRAVLPQGVIALQNDAVRIDGVVYCGSRGWLLPGSKSFCADDRKLFDRELIRLELSLKQAQQLLKQGDRLVVITHYPPFEDAEHPSQVTRLIAAYKADAVVFGHVHGKQRTAEYKTPMFDGIPYYLTSCDFLQFAPQKITLRAE